MPLPGRESSETWQPKCRNHSTARANGACVQLHTCTAGWCGQLVMWYIHTWRLVRAVGTGSPVWRAVLRRVRCRQGDRRLSTVLCVSRCMCLHVSLYLAVSCSRCVSDCLAASLSISIYLGAAITAVSAYRGGYRMQ